MQGEGNDVIRKEKKERESERLKECKETLERAEGTLWVKDKVWRGNRRGKRYGRRGKG